MPLTRTRPGSALHPYRTLSAALSGAAAGGASVIRMEAGTFTSPTPVTIPGIAIELEGGYGILPDGTWSRSTVARTALTAPAQLATATTIPGTPRTLTAARTPRSAFTAAPSADVLLDGVDLSGIAGPSATNQCGVALSMMPSARVRLENARVAMVDVPSANGCRIGILLPNSTSTGDGVSITAGSSVAGVRAATSVTLPTGTTLVGVATGTRPVLLVTDSRVVGLEAPAVNAVAVASWAGVLSVRSAGVELRRATVLAAQLPQTYVSPSGFVAAVDMAQGGAIRIDNSFLATPTGASLNVPLYAEGTLANPLTQVDLTWTTVSAGRDYLGTVPNVFGAANAVQLAGYLGNVRWINNTFAQAAAHSGFSSWLTVFPASEFTSGAAVTVVATGNAFSAPAGTEMVHVNCGEFVGCGFTEAEVNAGAPFSFMSGWNASFSGNYVLTGDVSIGPPVLRLRVYLDDTGRVRSVNSAGVLQSSRTGTVRLLDDGGVDLASAPEQNRIDLGGIPRATVGQRSDIGAWIF